MMRLFYRQMVRGCLLLLGLFLLAGCGRHLDVSVSWKKPHSEVKAGTTVVYKGLAIGEVGSTQAPVDGGEGVVAKVRLNTKYAHYIRQQTTFLVATNGAGRAIVEAFVPDPDAPPVVAGAVLTGTESRTEITLRELVINWRRTGMVLIILVAVLLIPLLLLRLLVRVWALLLCAVAGVAGVIWLAPFLGPYVVPQVPQGVPPDLAVKGLAFLLGATACMFLLGLFRFGRANR